jgi:hypothetical protein
MQDCFQDATCAFSSLESFLKSQKGVHFSVLFQLNSTLLGRILSRITTLRQRPLYSAIVGGIECIALGIAPLLAGVITRFSSWRVCFYISIPFGVLTILITFFFMQKSPPTIESAVSFKDLISKLDIPGSVLFLPLTICLVLALQWGGTMYKWQDWQIILLFSLFGVLLIAYSCQQYLAKQNATFTALLLRERTLVLGALYMFTTSGALYVFSYYVTPPCSSSV